MLAIEYEIGELPYPIAKDKHTRLAVQWQVELYVAMPINVVVYIFVRPHILFGVLHQVFFVFAKERKFFAVRTFHAALFCPTKSQLHSPPRVKEVQQSLAGTVVEYLSQDFEQWVGVAKPIAVCQIEYLVVDFGCYTVSVQYHATFFFQVSVCPNIVVASEEMHLYAHICKL